MRRIPPELCARCKGYRKLCGLPRCPILERIKSYYRVDWNSKEVEGPSPPSPLVGERGYPRVPVSLGIPIDGNPELKDDPLKWSEMDLGVYEVARLRMEMLHPFKVFDARRPEELLRGELLWGAVSERPVDAEARLLGKPRPPKLDGLLAPIGPATRAEEVKVESNPKVDPLLERKYEERIKAEVAIKELFIMGRSIYLLQKALSLGMLGIQRRLVPTRWAITAVDTIVAKVLKEDILSSNWLNSVKLGRYEHYANVYEVLLLPGPPVVEMVEIWEAGSLWAREKVVIYNREGPLPTSKAEDQSDGGFHALKVGVLRALAEKRVSATALVIRKIKPDYFMPLGVWQVREGAYKATLKALESPRYELSEALSEMSGESRLFKTLKQKRLTWYMRPEGGSPTS